MAHGSAQWPGYILASSGGLEAPWGREGHRKPMVALVVEQGHGNQLVTSLQKAHSKKEQNSKRGERASLSEDTVENSNAICKSL